MTIIIFWKISGKKSEKVDLLQSLQSEDTPEYPNL